MKDLKIQKTKDYDMFTFLDENRKVDRHHVKDIVNSIREKNLLHLNPIIVNTSGVVIDGQHRLQAAQELKEYIYFIMDDNLGINDVQLLNAKTDNWKLIDFVESYVERYHKGEKKYEDYETLKVFMITYGVSLTVATGLLRDSFIGSHGGSRSGFYQMVREGRFKVVDEGGAIEIIKGLIKLSPYLGVRVHGTRDYVNALSRLSKKYSFDQIVDIVKKSGRVVSKQISVNRYLEVFEEISDGKLKI